MSNTLTEQLNTMYTTTWYLRRKTIMNQVFTATPFWYLMTKKGKIDTQSGGRNIEQPLQYAKNETCQFIGRGGTVELAETDPLTTCYWDWKTMTGHLIRYRSDFQKNRGQAELIKKVNSDIDNLTSSLIDKAEVALFGDGTSDSNMAFDGLDNIVAEAPATGTVAGLNRATYSWWRNRSQDMASYPAAIFLRKYMVNMFNNCGLIGGEGSGGKSDQTGEGGSRFPDILVCAQDVYELYDTECFEGSRILMGDRKMADLGFGDLSFMGRPLTWSPSCKAQSLYFLNSAVMKFVSDPIENFSLGEWLPILNQPGDVVAHSLTTGNLTAGNCSRLGVLFNITA
jgi:hypothetical protein